MTEDVIYVDKDEDLVHVIDLMKKNNITKIPVVENKKIVGIITDRMISYKLGSIRSRMISTSRLHASSVTKKGIKTVEPDMDVSKIFTDIGVKNVEILPVADKEKRLCGVVTKADLLTLIEDKKTKIQDIMKKNVFTVFPGDRIIHARKIMLNKGVSRLPVIEVENRNVIGILAEMEIALAFVELKHSYRVSRQKYHLARILVRDYMKRPAITSKKDVTVYDAALMMKEEDIGGLPIIDDNGSLTGLVTRTDLLETVSI
jgi:CBS domain-containing protein